MGIYRQDYIVWGWKLPGDFKKANSEALDVFSEQLLPYLEGHEGIQHMIIMDQMCGKYIVFGKIVAISCEHGWNFHTLNMNELDREDVTAKFIDLFDTNPPDLPTLFIFSNFS